MRAAQLYGAEKLSVEEVDDPTPEQPGDAVVRMVAAAVCGTDVRGYLGMPGPVQGPHCGHEFVGVVTDIGGDVTRLRVGDLVAAPTLYADGGCGPCVRGVFTACRSGGMFGVDIGGGQAEAIRVPFADATLVPVPMDETDDRLPAVVALTDVLSTGAHAVASGRIAPGATVVVVGDGAVGLCSVLAARRAKAERIILLGRHDARLGIGTSFGATDIVTSRGEEAVAAVLELTEGDGADLVVDAVGEQAALDTAVSTCAAGGTVAMVGGPYGNADPLERFMRNINLTSGAAPCRTYIEELLPEVLDGSLDASAIFDHEVSLGEIVGGYQLMADRRATKVLVRP